MSIPVILVIKSTYTNPILDSHHSYDARCTKRSYQWLTRGDSSGLCLIVVHITLLAMVPHHNHHPDAILVDLPEVIGRIIILLELTPWGSCFTGASMLSSLEKRMVSPVSQVVTCLDELASRGVRLRFVPHLVR